MRIGDKVYIRGYVDEIRKDIVIIHNYGGYFGTAASEIIEPERTCSTCRYNANEWDEEPCDSCTSGGTGNHWKPTIEPERKMGKWVIDPGIGCKCSECDFDIGNDLDFMEYVNYCPNCGADMRGKEK